MTEIILPMTHFSFGESTWLHINESLTSQFRPGKLFLLIFFQFWSMTPLSHRNCSSSLDVLSLGMVLRGPPPLSEFRGGYSIQLLSSLFYLIFVLPILFLSPFFFFFWRGRKGELKVSRDNLT